jgi:glycosyltransferase involved in cell wall biosynthesis
MRIAVFAGYFAPHVGGYCHNIHELSKRLVAKGHEVDIITCSTEPQVLRREDIEGVHILRMPLFWHVGGVFPLPAPSSELLAVVRDNSYDVIITQSRIFATSVLGAMCSWIHGIPLIHVERGSCHTVLGIKVLSQMVKVYDHTIGRRMMSWSAKTIGISWASSEFIQHMCPKANPQTIYNGIKMPEISRIKKDRIPRIVFTGRIIYAKGVQDLIEAFSRINPHAELVIVGGGVYLEALKKQVNKLPEEIAKRILFTGEVKPGDITGILAQCDMFVNPSYSEGLPTSVTEAASMGLPIIATNVGGTSEIIQDGITGLLVTPRNVDQLEEALRWMITHWDRAALMGIQAQIKVREFDWEKITDQWEKVLLEAVSP